MKDFGAIELEILWLRMTLFKLFGEERENDVAHTTLIRSEQLMRTWIAVLPSGCYRHEPKIDGDLERV